MVTSLVTGDPPCRARIFFPLEFPGSWNDIFIEMYKSHFFFLITGNS